MEKVLSVVIPAFNSQDTLERAVSSLLVPELLEQLEVIIVDDGSQDRTAELAEGFCCRYPHTVRLIRQENRGHGGAVTRGIREAEGRYVKVLDSDDWAESASLPAFLEELSRDTRDVILTHYETHEDGSGRTGVHRSEPEAWGKCWTPGRLAMELECVRPVLAFHGLTYRRAFYNSLDLELTPWVYYEDQEYLLIPLCCAGTVGVLDLLIYHYRLGRPGQSVSRENRRRHLGDARVVLQRLLEAREHWPILREYGRDRLFRRLLRSFLVTTLITAYLDLRDPAQGAGILEAVRVRDPRLYREIRGPALVLQAMGKVHISGETVERWIQRDIRSGT